MVFMDIKEYILYGVALHVVGSRLVFNECTFPLAEALCVSVNWMPAVQVYTHKHVHMHTVSTLRLLDYVHYFKWLHLYTRHAYIVPRIIS